MLPNGAEVASENFLTHPVEFVSLAGQGSGEAAASGGLRNQTAKSNLPYVASLWVMENGAPRLFYPVVHGLVTEGFTSVLNVRMTIRKRLPQSGTEKAVCENRPDYSWNKVSRMSR